MWKELCLHLLLTIAARGELSGDHICIGKQNVVVNVTEYFLSNVTVREYKWCLNVPPRCSFYTVRQLNQSRLVERNDTRLTDKCCLGFKPNHENTYCIPDCGKCIHGYCLNGNCDCRTGYTGEFCHIECDEAHWGKNCQYDCNCKFGSCNSQTGVCECPLGHRGPTCEETCPAGFYGKECQEKCNCEGSCDPVTGLCLATTTNSLELDKKITTKDTRDVYITNSNTFGDITLPNLYKDTVYKSTPTLDLYEKINEEVTQTLTTPITTPEHTEKNVEDDIVTSAASTENVTPANTKGINISFTNNGVFSFDENKIEENVRILKPDISSSENKTITDGNVFDERSSVENGSFQENEDTLNENIVKHYEPFIVSKENLSAVMVKHQVDYRRHNKKKIEQRMEEHVINTVSVSTSLTIIVILIAVIIISTIYYKHTRKKVIDNNGKVNGVHRISVVTHSVFHAPLPDPPPFKNPVFMLPIEAANDGTNFSKIICDLELLQNGSSETMTRDFTYDHPPSTGSYRAASIPEPSDLDSSQSCPSSPAVMLQEPVYDEIPCAIPPAETPAAYDTPAPLYANTIGKTRF